MHELGKFDFKLNVIPKALEQHISLSIDKKLVFIDNF